MGPFLLLPEATTAVCISELLYCFHIPLDLDSTSLDLQPLTSLPPLPPCTKQAARRARVWAGWLAVLCHKSVRPWCVYCAKTLEDRCRRGRAKAGGSLKNPRTGKTMR